MSLSLAYEGQEMELPGSEGPGPLELPPGDDSLDELMPLPLDSWPSEELDRSLDELLEDEPLGGGELDDGELLLGGGPLDGGLLGASLLLDGVPLDDGVLLSPEDDGVDELDGDDDEPLSLELLDEELSLDAEGDDELDGSDELGVDDDGVLGVELLEDGFELDGVLLLDRLDELEELPLLELLLLSELLDELEQQSQQQQPA
jgi:hypothetical protein